MDQIYSPEEEKDIQERVEKATKILKELDLFPSALVQKLNQGNDIFVDKIICYLQDNKYIKKPIKTPYDIKKDS